MCSCIFEFHFEPISQSTKERCLQYSWFTTLMQDPSLHPILTPGRQPESNGTICPFLSQTLNTETTIPACQSFYKAPAALTVSFHQPPLEQYLGELQSFYVITSGLDGHRGVCHGGLLLAMLDHTMAVLARAYPGGINTYTKCLRIDLQKPLRTPGAVLCRAWITKVEGRKIWAVGRIEDEEGDSYTTGEGLFLKGGQVKL